MFGTTALILHDSLRIIAALACIVVIAATPYVLFKGRRFGWPRQLRIIGAALVGGAIVGGYLQTLGTPAPSVWRLSLITLGALAQATGLVVFLAHRKYRELDEDAPGPRQVDMLAHFPMALIVADQQSRMVSVSGDTMTVLGWSASELKGRPLASIIPPRFVAQHFAGVDRLIQTGEIRVAGKLLPLYAMDRDRRERPVTLMVLPLSGVRFLGVLLPRDTEGAT